MNGVVIAETLRRHVTSGAWLAFLALLAIVALGASTLDRPGAMWPTLVSLLAIIAGAGVIGPEFSSGTLQLVLVKPVNRATYLISRVAGVVLAVACAAIIGAVLELAGRAVWREEAVPWVAIGAVLLNVLADSILTTSLLALLGSLTRAYFNVAIYFAVMVTLSVGSGLLAISRGAETGIGKLLQRFSAIEGAINAVSENLFPEVTSRFDAEWLLIVLSNAAIALVLACLAFRRREVPYGAD